MQKGGNEGINNPFANYFDPNSANASGGGDNTMNNMA
jgi:hypothetical protein